MWIYSHSLCVLRFFFFGSLTFQMCGTYLKLILLVTGSTRTLPFFWIIFWSDLLLIFTLPTFCSLVFLLIHRLHSSARVQCSNPTFSISIEKDFYVWFDILFFILVFCHSLCFRVNTTLDTLALHNQPNNHPPTPTQSHFHFSYKPIYLHFCVFIQIVLLSSHSNALQPDTYPRIHSQDFISLD